MELTLAFPATWPRDEVDGLTIVTAPGYKLVPDLVFEIGPLASSTELHGDEWVGRGARRGCEVRRSPVEHATTRTGWPMTLHPATLHDGGVPYELRLLARYELVGGLAGAVLVRVTNAKRYARRRTDILELLATARPVFTTDEPAAISELWDLALSR